jgi:hypothetical protein
LELLDKEIRSDSMNVRIHVPNSLRPHYVQVSKRTIKALDNFGHVLLTDYEHNESHISIGIMTIDGMIELPEIPLSKIAE